MGLAARPRPTDNGGRFIMSKKLYASLASLVVIGAFAVVPAAQAAKWYVNGTELKEGIPKKVVSWGTLTLTSAAGAITCSNYDGATIENKGGVAVDKVTVFQPVECSSPACPAVVTVEPEKLPWASEVFEKEAVLRDKYLGVNVRVKCFIPGGETFLNVVFSGEQYPSLKNGTSALKPSSQEFEGEASGSLASEVGPGTTTGKDKQLGYNEQETITVK